MKPQGFLSTIPLLAFVGSFLFFGIYYGDFYAFPSPLSALIGIVMGFIILKGNTTQKLNELLRGCGDSNIMTMCIIYLLAGAFATVSKTVGAVDSMVNLGLTYIPIHYFPAAVFILASFLSVASGTSVGAIVALAPMVIELAEKGNLPLSVTGAALLCGAMFGDNLSVISDTTIAATQSLGTNMKDKFRVNSLIALPAALVSLGLFIWSGLGGEPASVPALGAYSWFLMMPYLLVILLSASGVNVFVSLFVGIVFSGIIGMANGSFDFITLSKTVYEGFTSMADIFFLSLLTGGLAAMVEKAGGITFILDTLFRFIRSKRWALLGMGTLVSIVNLAVANNTISIIISGKIAKEISQKYGIHPAKSASVLDIFSCYIQGLIPYGAQILILISLSGFKIEYLSLFSHAYYLHALIISTLIYIRFKM